MAARELPFRAIEDETIMKPAAASSSNLRNRIFPVALVFASMVAVSALPVAANADAVSSQLALKGQRAVCAGNSHKTFNIDMRETSVRLSDDLETVAWTFNGTVPGPVLEACVGDTVTIMLTNHGSMAHGLDTHAFRISAKKFGPVAPGESLKIESKVTTPGVFMYHCANGEMTDQHIKMSMSGAMIVYPRPQDFEFAPAKEFVVVQGSAYGEPNDKGKIEPESHKMEANTPTFYFYNGRLDHKPIGIEAGRRVRLYFLNTSPYVSSVHVIGTILDVAHASGNPKNAVDGVQTFGVEDGNGAIVEFTAPEPGAYLLVDHDHLGFMATGFVMPFAAK
jgi:nitrite reductase (NO-forming)